MFCYENFFDQLKELGESQEVPGDDVEDDHHVGVDPGGAHIDQERHEGVPSKGHEDGHDAGLDGGAGDVVHDRAGSVNVDEGPKECDDERDWSCGELGTLEDAQEVVDGGKEHCFKKNISFSFSFLFFNCWFLYRKIFFCFTFFGHFFFFFSFFSLKK